MSKLTEAVDALEDEREAHQETLRDTAILIDAIRRHHDTDHGVAMMWCAHDVCRAVRDLEGAYEG